MRTTPAGVDGIRPPDPAASAGPAIGISLEGGPATCRSGCSGEGDSHGHVLVCDDDPVVVAIATRVFEKQDIDVIVQTDGSLVSWSVARKRPDAIVLDVWLPGRIGLQVLQDLRSAPSRSKLPVLVTTSDDSIPTITRAPELGANDYLLEPFTPADLRARVAKLLASTLRRSLSRADDRPGRAGPVGRTRSATTVPRVRDGGLATVQLHTKADEYTEGSGTHGRDGTRPRCVTWPIDCDGRAHG